jgi:hypothetical protein
VAVKLARERDRLGIEIDLGPDDAQRLAQTSAGLGSDLEEQPSPRPPRRLVVDEDLFAWKIDESGRVWARGRLST